MKAYKWSFINVRFLEKLSMTKARPELVAVRDELHVEQDTSLK